MSDDKKEPIDHKRYFNDPEYRKKILKERKEKGESAPGRPSPSYRKAWIWASSIAGVLCLFVAGYVFYLFQGLPSADEFENPETAIASEVRSRDGVTLDKYFTENRKWVRYEDISPHVIDALVATEDHRFYNHWGIDMYATLAIPWHLINGRWQGASTISQQLARNLYKKIGQEFSIARKFREMITAAQLEKRYTKREIAEMYLNTVEYPNSTFGIEAASQTHYGKPAKELNINEAAMMVGSLQAIYAYNPRLFPEKATARRNIVLAQMHKRDFLTDQEYITLTEEPIGLDYHPPFKTGRQSRYFGEYVRQQVQPWLEENGYDLYKDGLVIYTTIDSRLQRHAERAVKTKLDSLQKIYEAEWTSPGGEYMDEFWEKNPLFLRQFLRETDRYKNGFSKYDTKIEKVVFDSLFADTAFVDSVKRARTKLESGFVAIEPSNGKVLAWVGGTDYGNVQYDHVYQSRRQAGSTFKPFVYAVAIDNGYKPYHKFSKFPVTFRDRAGKIWNPKDETVHDGPINVSLREALARSMNNVTVRLLPEIAGAPGTNKLWELDPAARKIKAMASNLGIDMSKTPAYPSIALGTAEVSLLELTSAYTTFANKGVHIEPIAITRIEDREGNILKEFHPDYTKEVISPETAYIITDMLRGVIRGGEDFYGTGVRLRNVYGVRQDVAGKTGTTQNSADNWFVGMMPHIVMGAWVGGADRRIRFPEDTYIGQGARSALPIVGTFINYATADDQAYWKYDAFDPPPGFVMPEDPEKTNNELVKDKDKGRIGW
ncbi:MULTISPECIES: penicillin-binding protein 1A [Gracilimonas]|uniref:Transglycosylase domain-containing protein n=1 Tax=Gracilimonas sediminicola TaxID=2952158 RepID=A0A9X2L5T2_9BACT|nr:transglycosylase domain-containing protein [Gracilimonas sediminicola]MCP9292894.1 transglycosylase domain-containing protein [Gracilimonas sediminicola]